MTGIVQNGGGQATNNDKPTGPATANLAAAPADAGGDYDLLPYPSMPFADTQPAVLAALATLFTIDPPDVTHARVLELGCAAGGNIIPLAARFPDAHFTGIDLSRRHIDDGCKRIADLTLTNISLIQANLATLTLPPQQFDYVICNGVFSWVPEPVQDAIFRLCQTVLAPNGVATVSYNVLPGWHLRMVIRDLCLHHAGTEGTPRQRVARARAALERIASAAVATDPYGLLLRTEARRLRSVPSAYILGEFLAPDNRPCHVQDFIDRAAGHGLDYLCEADLCATLPQNLDQSARGRLTSFAGTGRPAIEQHIDFLTGRLFRRSVLVRQQPGAAPPRILNPGHLSSLHISCPARRDADQSTGNLSVFTDERGRPITVTDPCIAAALSRLEAAFPATLTLAELSSVDGNDADAGEAFASRIRHVILALVLASRASISATQLRIGQATDPRPLAWQVARVEAASGQPWLTSLRHVGEPAQPVLTALLPYLDGHHDQAALRDRFKAALQSQAVTVPELSADDPPPTPDRLDAIAGHHVAWALSYLARHAFLQPAALPDV